MATSSSTAVVATSGVGMFAANHAGGDALCRCRVLYIGSAVPTITKDGLQGIQQPLRERYPATDSPDAKGIDSWLSVWSNGLLLEYVDGERKTESAFFPIVTLHYCAAVRYVNMSGFAVEGGGERFIPLDSPFAQIPDSPHPPIFAAIFRRTHGVKVLECHSFVCTNEKAANALVRCCFHAYADTLYLKMDEKLMGQPGGALRANKEPHSRSGTPSSELNLSEQENGGLDGPMADWNERAIGQKAWQRRQQNGEYDASSISSSVFRQQKLKKGGAGGETSTRSEGQPEGMLVVPYGGGDFGRQHTGSQSEMRDFHHHQQRAPGAPPFFYTAMPPGGPFMRPGGPYHHPPPPHMFPPPSFYPPPGARFVPFMGPFGGAPPPHFGRFAPHHPFPPPHHAFPPRFFFMPPPPPFMGAHHAAARSKSPERSGPIITETVYDTFPRHNRATYEEPIYMPSSNGGGGGAVPPQASYKPGSFSPEIYEHYYETYNKQQQRESGGRKNVSRSNSDASGGDDSNAHHYWESYEASMFPPQQHRRAFGGGNTPGSSKQQLNGGTPKMARGRKGEEDGAGGTLTQPVPPEVAVGGTLRGAEMDSFNRGFVRKGAPTGAGGEPRPETPPADYDVVADSGKRREQRQNNGGTVAY